jgi:enoyl-CoA hydratase
MSDEPVRYELQGDVALLHFDDGKANVFSHASIDAMTQALDAAEKEAKAVVVIGRPGRFSAGFDLSVMSQGGEAVGKLVCAGALLAIRFYSSPLPTLAAVNGHALAMGAVLLLSIDERFCADDSFKIGLNETAIGMTLPHFALILARDRIAPTHLGRATSNAEIYAPKGAARAGFVDRVVPADDLIEETVKRAKELATLDSRAHSATKMRVRAASIELLRESLSEFGAEDRS